MMELMYGAMLCICMAMGVIAMDGGLMLADNSERDRYEAITINKPVMRYDYQPPHAQRHAEVDANELPNPDASSPATATSSVRCFCNLPECISTGYMCKSSSGGCFSDLYQAPSSSRTAYRGRHGCIELLTDRSQKEQCQRLPNGNRYPATKGKSTYDHPRSLLHCCHEDMCNHADNPQTKDLINDTALGGDQTDDTRVIGNHMDVGYSDSDVWFKAATIAVPICGAVILFVLIAMAIRLLKTESLNNSNYKLGCQYVQAHGKHNCNKYHEQHYCRPTAQPFLRKDGIANHHHSEYPRRSLPASIILSKNINERYNSKPNHEYNLLPMKNNIPHVHDVHKCYDNKNLSLTLSTLTNSTCNSLAFPQSSSANSVHSVNKQINTNVNTISEEKPSNAVHIDDSKCDTSENKNV